jgi:hypothetical protein
MTRPRLLVRASCFTLRADSSLTARLGSPRSPDANRKPPRVRSASPETARLPRKQHAGRTLLGQAHFQNAPVPFLPAPIFMYSPGTVAPERVTQAEQGKSAPLPSLHSELYYPIPEPSIKTGVLTMSMAVLNLLGR